MKRPDREANRGACRKLQKNFIGLSRNKQVRERKGREKSQVHPCCRQGKKKKKKGEGYYKKKKRKQLISAGTKINLTEMRGSGEIELNH